MNGVNLIPASRRELAARRSRIRAWAVILAGVAILSAPAAAAFRAMWYLDSGPARLAIAAAQTETQDSGARLLKVRGETAKLNQAEMASRMVGEHPDWSLLLQAINLVRGDSVALESFDLRFTPPVAAAAAAPATSPPAGTEAKPTVAAVSERYTVNMRGIATDLSRVMTFVGRLEGLGVMERVAMKQSRAENNRGVVVTGFDVECTLADRLVAPTPKDTATAEVPAPGDRP